MKIELIKSETIGPFNPMSHDPRQKEPKYRISLEQHPFGSGAFKYIIKVISPHGCGLVHHESVYNEEEANERFDRICLFFQD